MLATADGYRDSEVSDEPRYGNGVDLSSEPTESVFIKSFQGRGTADQAYETMRQLERERKVDIRTAMTIARQEDGKLKLVHKRRLTVGKGLVAGGGVGLL